MTKQPDKPEAGQQLIEHVIIGHLVDRLDHIHFYLLPCIPTDITESDHDSFGPADPNPLCEKI
jgi:hypothetical protein